MAMPALRNSPDLVREMRAHIGRHTDKSFDWDAFPGSRGFPELARAQMRYIGAGGSPKLDDPNTLRPGDFTLSLIHQGRQLRGLPFARGGRAFPRVGRRAD